MKVTTDACLFGAWCAFRIQNSKLKSENALDIGAGTGLLSLMIAQKNDLKIDAIEIDEQAAIQAKENFSASSLKNSLHVINDSLQHATHHQIIKLSNYQIIFSNPPFFEQDLKSDNKQRNLALHSAALSLEELFTAVDQLLDSEGNFFLLLPYHRKQEGLQKALTYGLHLKEEMNVKQTPKHDYFRVMLWLTRIRNERIAQSEITIKDGNNYTEQFTSYLKDYYLYL